MGAYNRTNGEPCCGSPALQKILREEWGFAGHFVSDCWAVADFHSHHKVTARPEESVKLALENGCDVNCGCTYQKDFERGKRGPAGPEVRGAVLRAAVHHPVPAGDVRQDALRLPGPPGRGDPGAPGPVGKDGPGEPGAAEKRRRPAPGPEAGHDHRGGGAQRRQPPGSHGQLPRHGQPVHHRAGGHPGRGGAGRGPGALRPGQPPVPAPRGGPVRPRAATAPRSWRPSARAWRPCPRPSGWRSSTTWPGPTTCPTASPRPSPRPPAPT